MPMARPSSAAPHHGGEGFNLRFLHRRDHHGIIEAGIVSAGLVGLWTRLVHGLSSFSPSSTRCAQEGEVAKNRHKRSVKAEEHREKGIAVKGVRLADTGNMIEKTGRIVLHRETE